MHLNIRSNHAMRLMMYCALNDEGVASIAEIARACNMSETHLAKIAHQLAALGFVETVRGRRGGVRLARPVGKLNVGDIVRSMEITACLVECLDPETNTCPLIEVCRFRTIIGEALEGFFQVLERYTLADLVSDGGGLRAAMGLDAVAMPAA